MDNLICQCAGLSNAYVDKEIEINQLNERINEAQLSLAGVLAYRDTIFESICAIVNFLLPKPGPLGLNIADCTKDVKTAIIIHLKALGLVQLLIDAIIASIAILLTQIIVLVAQMDHFESLINSLKVGLEIKKEELKTIKEEMDDCFSHLVRCDKCGEHFSTYNDGCIKQCKGCGNYYCDHCFNIGLENYESKKQ